MNIDNEILSKLDAITEQLSKIISALNRKQNKEESAEGKSRYEVNVEHSKEPTKNPDWMKVRGKFQRANRKYPDWITLFVKAKDSEIVNKGQTLAVVGELREAEGKNGKPLFSLFADSVEVIGMFADSVISGAGREQQDEPEQFNTKGNYDEEVPF